MPAASAVRVAAAATTLLVLAGCGGVHLSAAPAASTAPTAATSSSATPDGIDVDTGEVGSATAGEGEDTSASSLPPLDILAVNGPTWPVAHTRIGDPDDADDSITVAVELPDRCHAVAAVTSTSAGPTVRIGRHTADDGSCGGPVTGTLRILTEPAWTS